MKKTLTILTIIMMVMSIFMIAYAQTGTFSPHNLFYKPDYGASGVLEWETYNDYIDIADNQVWANKTNIEAIDAELAALKFTALSDTPNEYTDQAGKVVKVNDTEDALEFGEDVGEVNTASNVGGQVEVFKQKTGADLEFKTLKARDSQIELGWTELVGNWTLNDVSYDNVSFSVASQDSYSTGIFFKPDGSKMYMVGSNSDKVHQYSINATSVWHLTGFENTDVIEFSIEEDQIKLDDLGAPEANTDLNVSTTTHGLMPVLSDKKKEFINGKGLWSLPFATVTIAADDTTPDVSGGGIFITSANSKATKITDLDNPTVGETIILVGGSATFSSTIPDGATVDVATFTGTGLNDATSGGIFTGTEDTNYKVQIDGVGDADTFKWSDDGGSTWKATTVAITGSAQDLNNGVTITFGATTGHTLNDAWTFTAYPDRFKLSSGMTLGLDDSITLYVKADNYYIELSRSDN